MEKCVLLFNKITEPTLDDLQDNNWIDDDDQPLVRILISAPPFNVKHKNTHPRIAEFLKRVELVDIPVYGKIIPAVMPLAKESVLPYHWGMDNHVINKAENIWPAVSAYLLEKRCFEVVEKGSYILEKIKSAIRPDLTIEEYHCFLTELLGPNWYEKSHHLHVDYILLLFGMEYEKIQAIKNPWLMKELKWIANFICLFKPVTQYQNGCICDMINFAAMISPLPRTYDNTITALQHIETFDLSNVIAAYFDMEPDDIGVISFLHKINPSTQIIRIYSGKTTRKLIECILQDKITFRENDRILIDIQLNNHFIKKFYSHEKYGFNRRIT